MKRRAVICLSLLLAGICSGVLAAKTLSPLQNSRPAPPHPISSIDVPGAASPVASLSSATSIPFDRTMTLPALIAAARTISPPGNGTGTISGVITNTDGTPASGVFVLASKEGDQDLSVLLDAMLNSSNERELRRAVRSGVATASSMLADLRHTTTDGNGRYTIHDLDHCSYTVTPLMDGYEFNSTGTVIPDATRNFTATRLVKVRCSVLMPDGNPAPATMLLCRSRHHYKPIQWTPGNESISLAPGMYEITANLLRKDHLARNTVSLNLSPDTVTNLTFSFQRCAAVCGRIILPPGVRPEYISVSLIKEGTEAEPEDPDSLPRYNKYVSRTGGYRYNFEGMPPGDYDMVISDTYGSSPVYSSRVSITEEKLTFNPVIRIPDRAERVIVWATGPDGSMLDNVRIGCDSACYMTGCANILHSARNPDGSWWVHQLAATNPAAAGSNTVSVSSGRYGTLEVSYVPTAESTVHVRFPETGSLKVCVSGLTGKRIEFDVVATRSGKENLHAAQTLQQNGEAIFKRLPAGHYDIALISRVISGPLCKSSILVKPGDNELTLTPPALYELTVNIKNSKHINSLRLTSDDPGKATMHHIVECGYEPDHVTITGLPAGRYFIKSSGSDPGKMSVSVPEQGSVEFAGRPLNAIKVRITNQARSLADTGLADGDLIVAINGMNLSNVEPLDELLRALSTVAAARATVLRGGRLYTLSIDTARLAGYNAGSRLEATSQELP